MLKRATIINWGNLILVVWSIQIIDIVDEYTLANKYLNSASKVKFKINGKQLYQKDIDPAYLFYNLFHLFM